MSVRTFDFKMDGEPILIDGNPAKGASMSWTQAERFIEEGRELLKKDNATEQEWLSRTLRVVSDSLKRAGNEVDAGKLKEEFDIPTLNEMNFQILEKSGLRSANGVGESQAAPEATKTISKLSAVA